MRKSSILFDLAWFGLGLICFVFYFPDTFYSDYADVSTLFQNFPIDQITERSEELKSKSEEQLVELNNFINTNYLKFLQTAERIDGFGQDLVELKNHFLGLSVILKNLNQVSSCCYYYCSFNTYVYLYLSYD
jgi:hypothetical protein